MIHKAFGRQVTLQRRIFRLSWPMSNEQYRTPKVKVGR